MVPPRPAGDPGDDLVEDRLERPCGGNFQPDFNTWMTTHFTKAPAGGDSAYLQCWFRDPHNTSNQTTSLSNALRASISPWYRDPLNTSNQTTSLSDAIEFTGAP